MEQVRLVNVLLRQSDAYASSIPRENRDRDIEQRRHAGLRLWR